MMYLGSISIGVNRFMMETSPRVKRIHISHDDSDGCGCTVVAKYAFGVLNPDSQSPITYINISNPSTITERITEVVCAALVQGFDKEHDMLAFLITDIGKVDPQVFKDINDSGIPCYFIVIDHHVRQYDDIDPIDTVQTADGAIIRPSGWYFVTTDLCATYILNDIIFRIYKSMKHNDTFVDSGVQQKALIMTSALQEFAMLVNKYDTGNWGEWADTDQSSVPDEIKLQLIFSSYGDDINTAIDDMITMLSTGGDYLPLSIQWREIYKDQYTALMDTYRSVCSRLKESPDSQNMSFTADLIRIQCPLRVKYLTISNPDESIQFFSLISKAILESDTSIDVLMLVNRVRGTVDFRSASQDMNVAKIAHANGGGGHPRASGAPIALE